MNKIISTFIFLAISVSYNLAQTIDLSRQDNSAPRGYGIAGNIAPDLSESILWYSKEGELLSNGAYQLEDEKIKVIYCFQSWCPGCHSHGLPALQKLVHEFGADSKIQFLAVQTVFEGFTRNSLEKTLETQQKYALEIPFGYDLGSHEKRPSIMTQFKTGGTPWFIFIDKNNQVIYNGFDLNVDKAIQFLKSNI